VKQSTSPRHLLSARACGWLGSWQGEEPATFNLKIDNQYAIMLSKNPIFHDRSKHIDTKYHYIRQCIEEDRVKCQVRRHQRAASGYSDQTTWALGGVKFVELRSRIGLVNIK
jgi:hypothetical protein